MGVPSCLHKTTTTTNLPRPSHQQDEAPARHCCCCCCCCCCGGRSRPWTPRTPQQASRGAPLHRGGHPGDIRGWRAYRPYIIEKIIPVACPEHGVIVLLIIAITIITMKTVLRRIPMKTSKLSHYCPHIHLYSCSYHISSLYF